MIASVRSCARLTVAPYGGREGLVGVGIAGGIVAGIAAIALAAVFGGRRR